MFTTRARGLPIRLEPVEPGLTPAHTNGHGKLTEAPRPRPLGIMEQLRADAEAYEARGYTGMCPVLSLLARQGRVIARALEPDATVEQKLEAIALLKEMQRRDREG